MSGLPKCSKNGHEIADKGIKCTVSERFYAELMEKCEKSGNVWIIGRTALGFNIPIIRRGGDTLLVGSVHAREHITTDLLFELIKGSGLDFDVVPCLNIDGVMLCRYGAEFIKDSAMRERLVKINGGKDFSLWKANINCVDINVNFAAGWGSGAHNVRYPASANYIGEFPESEPETRAAAELLRSGKYVQVVCYHTKGEVVYWGFGDNYLFFDEAERFAKSIDYKLTTSRDSAGGMKDYFDLIFPGLGLTVEVGEDRFPHPYPERELGNLVKRHMPGMEILYENGKKIRRVYERGD